MYTCCQKEIIQYFSSTICCWLRKKSHAHQIIITLMPTEGPRSFTQKREGAEGLPLPARGCGGAAADQATTSLTRCPVQGVHSVTV